MKRLWILALVLTAGCQQSVPTVPSAANAQHVFIAIDTSGSARNMLGAYARGTSSAAMQLEPGLDRLTVMRFDDKPEEIFDGSAPESSEKFKSMLVSNLSPQASHKGTSQGRLFETIANWRQRGNETYPATVLVFTDGGNDDLSAEGAEHYRRAVAALAKDTNLKRIVFIGVRASQRSALRERFGPLTAKVQVQGEDDMGVSLRG